MKRIIGLFIIVALVVVLPVTHSIAQQFDKVEICQTEECMESDGRNFCVGKLQMVKIKNLSKYKNSGDQVDHYVYLGMDAKIRDAVEETYDVNLPSSYDCVFGLDSTGYDLYQKDGKFKVKLHKF
jgi:hypothetical protein